LSRFESEFPSHHSANALSILCLSVRQRPSCRDTVDMLPQCSHITKKRGVYYYRRRVPKSPGREVALSLRTRVFRVAECLATELDEEFERLTEDVTTDDKTDLAPILEL